MIFCLRASSIAHNVKHVFIDMFAEIDSDINLGR